MKVAGLTWWRNNYGSILQAYALQEKIKEYDDITYEILAQYSKNIVSVDNLLDKLKNFGVKQTVRRIIFRFGLARLRLRVSKLQEFVEEYLTVSEKVFNESNIVEANADYDAFLCGSDQIWNPELSPLDSMYWLGFAENSKRKIAYAPSFGADSVTEEQVNQIKSNLSDFHTISCREQSGTKLLNDVLKDNKCVTVLDPTLLVSRTIWDGICSKRMYQQKYIFVYILRGNKEQRRYVERFAKQKQLSIVTMPFLDCDKIEFYDLKFGNIKLWDASPAEFISAIRYAEYVFTDSFHCIVFSYLYHRTYFAFPKIGKSQMNRIKDLQNIFGISNRILEDGYNVSELEKYSDIDWNVVDQILDKKRKESEQYLKSSLGL